MFKRLVLLSLVLSTTFFTTTAIAGNAKMLFWYPGEAGSTTEAQPMINAFFEYVNAKIAPEAIIGSYQNTVDAGLTALSKEKPVVAIVSFAAATQNKTQLGSAQPLLATLPLPGKATTERYVMVGTRTTFKPGDKIAASEPMTAAFAREHLFKNLPADVTIVRNDQLIMQLKKMGDGQLDGIAILTPTEAATLERVSAAWAKNLKTMAKSEPVPSARVWLFDPSWKGAAKFKTALLAMGQDPAAQELLAELRLAGFAQLP